MQGSYRALSKAFKTNKIHPFGKLCEAHDTEHRLTKFAHPWTNGQVEKRNRDLCINQQEANTPSANSTTLLMF